MIQQANEAGFPLIVLPPDMQFSVLPRYFPDELTLSPTALYVKYPFCKPDADTDHHEGANLR